MKMYSQFISSFKPVSNYISTWVSTDALNETLQNGIKQDNKCKRKQMQPLPSACLIVSVNEKNLNLFSFAHLDKCRDINKCRHDINIFCLDMQRHTIL